MVKKIVIIKGQRFGKLTVINEVQIKILPSGQSNRAFLCRCDCGNTKEIRLVHLKRNKTRSCGCLQGEKHGDSGKRLYKIYYCMLSRCKDDYFEKHLYYDKNIRVCDEWANSYIEFRKWALRNGYNDSLQIDRKNNSKGYYPKNCRWTTSVENVNNRDNTTYITYKGNKESLQLLCRKLDKHKSVEAIRGRIKRGWNHDKAIDTPIRIGNYKRY